jgi:broad specificity phosphatase PhoE
MSTTQKKIIYFIRHGESVDNASPVYQSVNSPLSEKGKRQAESIAVRLSTLKFESLISSPILRAKETAQYIADKSNKEITFSDLFVERIKPTEVDGRSWTDEDASAIFREWEKSLYDPSRRVKDGENYYDINKRVDNALAFILDRSESTMTVVTHGYFLRAIIARILVGNNLNGSIMKRLQERASLENTGITVLHYRDDFEEDFEWRLWTYNDHSHFAE